MKAMVKTDKCVELLGEVYYTACEPLLFKAKCSDEFIPVLKAATNKGEAARKRYEELGITTFKTEEDALKSIFDKDDIFWRLTRAKALLCYVVCPPVKINSFPTDREETLSFLTENGFWTGEPFFDVVFDIMQIGTITAKDLEYEFWEACPDVERIPEYLKVTRGRFEDILPKLPNRDTYSYDNLLLNTNDNIYSTYIRQLHDIGIITADEANDLLVLLYNVIAGLHDNVDRIARTYNKIYIMAGVETQDIQKYESLLRDLKEYVSGNADTLTAIIERKNPNGEKMRWIGTSVEAIVFTDVFLGGSCSIFNKCFTLNNGGTLKPGNRGSKENKSYPIYDIINPYRQ